MKDLLRKARPYVMWEQDRKQRGGWKAEPEIDLLARIDAALADEQKADK